MRNITCIARTLHLQLFLEEALLVHFSAAILHKLCSYISVSLAALQNRISIQEAVDPWSYILYAVAL